jgi:RHS repeat-associated protein
MSVADSCAHFVRGRWLLGLLGLVLALGITTSARATYGPPYTNDSFYPGTNTAVTFGDLGAAISATIAEEVDFCPTCIISTSMLSGQAVAAVRACPAGEPNCDFSVMAVTIWATDSPVSQPRMVGACPVCPTDGTGSEKRNSHATGSSGDDSQGESEVGSLLVSDPINTATDNKFQQETDYRSPGRLTFRRFYNSQIYANTTELGPQWRHTFDRSLEFVLSSDNTGAIDSILLNRPDGSRETFQRTNGSWQTTLDNADTLTEQDDATGVPVGYTAFFAGPRLTESYSADGLLQSITEASGAVTTLQYSTASTPASQAPKPGLLLTVTDPNGRALNFGYDTSARLSNVALPDGGSLSYAYDSNGRLTSVTYPDSHSRQYVYNEASLYVFNSTVQTALTGIIDEKGTRYETAGYDANGEVTFNSFANGIDKYVRGGGTTTPLGAHFSLSAVTVQGMYKNGGSTAPCGNQCSQPWKSISYDSNGYPSSYTDFNNNVTTVTHNAVGLETQRVEAKGTTAQRTTNTTWDSMLRVPLTSAVLDAGGTTVAKSTAAYNARGQILASCDIDPSIADAAGYVCSTVGTPPTGVRRNVATYCDTVDSTECPIVGLQLSEQDARSNVTSYAYYLTDSVTTKHGDLKTITDALGHVTTFLAYDGSGRPTSIQDPNGVITTLTYKPRGWLASHSVAGATTTFTYTPFGAIETVTDPDGVVVTYAYDDAHRLIKITDGAGNSIQFTLDVAGDRIAENIYPVGNTTPVHTLTRTFNTLGQLTKVVDGLNNTVFNATASGSYDNNGNLVLSSDALGIQHKETVDALNRVASSIDNYNGSGTAQNTTTKLAYDALDQLTAVTDPSNLVTHYTYDGLGNRTALQSPDTGASGGTYDAVGNLLTLTDARSITSTTTYDALNRPIATTYPDTSSNVVYDYDEANSVTGCVSSAPIGRLTRIVEAAVTTVYCYDAHGNVIQKKQITSASTDTISYTYTAADRLSTLTEPDGTVVTDTYNTLGQLTTVQVAPLGGATQTAVSSAAYVPFGPVASYTLGNGQTVTRTYDANYNVSDVTSPALNLHFARDAMGNINALGNAPGANPAVETYSYDPLYRLTAVTDSGTAVESYTYNGTGDRLSKTSTGGMATGTYGYQTGTHLLTSIGSTARSYDANGNTIGTAASGQTLGFGYNNRDRLNLVQANQQTVANYTYNALGQRVGKAVSSPQALNQRFAYNESGQLLGEYGASNRDYIWMGNLPVATVDITGAVASVYFVTADSLGTPRAITDVSGAQIWQWPYQSNPFGEKPAIGSYAYGLRFPGQYYDVERGAAYNVGRDFDAPTGRFAQPDPSGLQGGIGLYVYGLNNAQRYFDPNGYQATNEQQGAIGIPGAIPLGPMNPGVRPLPLTDSGTGPRIRSPAAAMSALATFCASNPLSGAACVVAGCLIPRTTADSCADEPATPQLMQRCSSPDDECKQEWEDAIEECTKMLSGRNPSRGVTGGYRDIMLCAKGLVSERCGGNPLP